jgi:RNA-directed DNA polymerase
MEAGGSLEVQAGDAAPENRSGDAQMACAGNPLEWILERGGAAQACGRAVENKGGRGMGKMTAGQLKPYLKESWGRIKSRLMAGAYKPQPAGRAGMPKPGGGIRLLGMPTALDGMMRQAMAQVLNGIFGQAFSESSYGLRKGRSARDAMKAAQEHISGAANGQWIWTWKSSSTGQATASQCLQLPEGQAASGCQS